MLRPATNGLSVPGLTEILWLAASLVLAPAPAFGGLIQISSVELYVHDGSGLVTQLNAGSPTYSSALDANNEGRFGWTFTNTGLNPITNLRLLVFLDADIDRDENTFFNEYGEFVGLSLPSGAPAGAIVATGWEIDEPGFLYGDIVTNLTAGVLDNSNGVPSSAPDDTSLAMLFPIGGLDPGRTATLSMTISTRNIDGLRQLDPDSGSNLYLNGYASVDLASPVGGAEVPEPGTGALALLAGLSSLLLRAFRKNRAGH